MNNADKLCAVINKWAQPVAGAFLSGNLQAIPLFRGIENKVRSTGWVSPQWSLLAELSPLIEGVTGVMLIPIIKPYISKIDDALLPQLAHSVVDKALEKGSLPLLEGKIIIEREDLEELKQMLNAALPWSSEVKS